MKISQIGGEQALLERLLGAAGACDKAVLPNGDDAAVLKFGNSLLAVSTDTFVEGRHFSRDYFSAAQIGAKALEASASDLIAVGARPLYYFINLSIVDEEISFIEELYGGLYAAAERLAVSLMGGDTTSGVEELVISVTVLGEVVHQGNRCARSGAAVGDMIFVTGSLGNSAAGLAALQAGLIDYPDLVKSHLEPRCRIDALERVASIATAAIDVSDGLSSEIAHICSMSHCGAELNCAKIPLSASALKLAKELNCSALDWALSGGEDFELLYTVAPENINKAIGFEVGVITAEKRIFLLSDGVKQGLMVKGFNHFGRTEA